MGDAAQEVHPTILTAVPRFYEKVRERVLATAETFSALRRPIFEWGMEALHERSRARLRRHGHINAWQAFQARLADRIVAAAAAHHLYGGPLIIADIGTAATFDTVSKEGDYLGGAIAPGIGIAGRGGGNCDVVMAIVLTPVPAPASTSTGPSIASTALRWASLRPRR